MVGMPAAEARKFVHALRKPSSSEAVESVGHDGPQTAAGFAVGAAIIVQGLASAGGRKHNGALGLVEETLDVKGRHLVALLPSKAHELNVKPSNLRAASHTAAAAATKPPASLSAKPTDRSAAEHDGDLLDLIGKAQHAMFSAEAGVEASQPAGVEFESPPNPHAAAEWKAAIAGCTDVALNDAQPYGNGDQSFARDSLATDAGTRLKLARNSGMGFRLYLLGPFAQACAIGNVYAVEGAIELARRGGRAVRDSTPQPSDLHTPCFASTLYFALLWDSNAHSSSDG